ncbi:MAG: aspartate/glutamate racemase family protein [Alphaproteobacteria bacterium]
MTDQKTLTFLHTAPSHVARFDRLLAAHDLTALRVQHHVNEALLPHDGRLTDDLKRNALSIFMQLSSGADMVLCTCSTLGPVADIAAEMVDGRVWRIDRPMAQQALKAGQHILVAACLAPSIMPTQLLLMAEADEAQLLPMISPLIIEGAWQLFLDNNETAYAAAIAQAIKDAVKTTKPDAVILAQASMDCAEPLLNDCGVPVFSTPHIGVAAALDELGLI